MTFETDQTTSQVTLSSGRVANAWVVTLSVPMDKVYASIETDTDLVHRWQSDGFISEKLSILSEFMHRVEEALGEHDDHEG